MFFLSNLCIVCLNTCKNLKKVLIQDKEGILIQDKLKYCLPEIVDSHLQIPKYICINCISLLDCFYKFKQWCLRNNTIMTNYLRTLTSSNESYKYLSVNLTDIKSQNIQQAVSMDQTFSDVENDDDIRSEGKEDNEACIKETETVFKSIINFSDTLDIRNSHPLLNKEKDIIVKEEDFTFADIGDFEFYHETVKTIKYESIPSDSDDSLSCNEDLEEDSDDSNQNNENIFTNHEENENDLRKTNVLQCFICSSREFLHIDELKCHLEAHAVSTSVSKSKVNQSESLKVDNVSNCGSSNTEIDDIENNYNFADLVIVQLPEDNPSNSPTCNFELMDTSDLPTEKDNPSNSPTCNSELMYTSDLPIEKDNPSNSPTCNFELMDTSDLPMEKDSENSNKVPDAPCNAVEVPNSLNPSDSKDKNYVKVPSSKDGKSKIFFCIFCKKRVRTFARHLLTVHKDEKRVINIMRYPAKHKERQLHITKIRNEGSFLNNTSEKFSSGEYIVLRRPNESRPRNAEDYLPCIYCKGYYGSKSLHKHSKTCFFNDKTYKHRSSLVPSRALSLEEELKHLNLHPNVPALLSDLKDNEVYKVIKNDELLLRYASHLCYKNKTEINVKGNTRRKLKQLARFLLCIKKEFSEIIDLRDCLQPKNLYKIIYGVQKVCECNTTNIEEFRLAMYLKECANVLYCICIIDQDDEMKKNAKDVIDLLNLQYGAVSLSRSARKTLVETKPNTLGTNELNSNENLSSDESETNSNANMNLDDGPEAELQELANSLDVTLERKTKIKRTPWTTPEKAIVLEEFQHHFKNMTLPSERHIARVIRKNPELQRRTPAQVKSYISNQKQKKIRDNAAVE